ncbi:protein FAM107B isoform X1 [Amphiprion ocellaris]|uniref:protein FAM107B isoform X1 n=1 Tax=Amphiprion ocellaris TaxID=80972 RepID=UPI001649E25C|nr:protein FAM107B isoform X1 [Amphiprion ocellaris]
MTELHLTRVDLVTGPLSQKAYSIDHEPPPKQQSMKNGKHPKGKASAFADLHQNRPNSRKPSPVSGFVPPPDYLDGDEDDDIIKPKKLLNPVKASKSHQELHQELLSCKRGGVNVEMKPELQRVLESRRRDQQIRQKKQEDEARRKISPLEAELLKRHKKLEELEKQQQQQENLKAPEFVKVKENLRRTSFNSKEEKEV